MGRIGQASNERADMVVHADRRLHLRRPPLPLDAATPQRAHPRIRVQLQLLRENKHRPQPVLTRPHVINDDVVKLRQVSDQIIAVLVQKFQERIDSPTAAP